jgi:hypothetical protein
MIFNGVKIGNFEKEGLPGSFFYLLTNRSYPLEWLIWWVIHIKTGLF